MTTFESPTSIRGTHRLALPHTPPINDRACDAAASLAQAVQAAAAAIARNILQPVSRESAGVAFHPRALLALLAYCYLSGVYASEDIEDMMRRDTSFRALCGGEFPDVRTLRRFRRCNREPIEICLRTILRWQADRRGAQPSEDELIEQADVLVTTAIHMDLNEN